MSGADTADDDFEGGWLGPLGCCGVSAGYDGGKVLLGSDCAFGVAGWGCSIGLKPIKVKLWTKDLNTICF